ncbi:hypothetical protein FBU59_000625 [Linderina macrospora]|uniref:Uncharacterized protein n=1 Tax=Linderina macrospora TaxID=4868 RepID=A0ACC1JGF2_9FUNG|nr:hypothetical protein FBU59_000625 [Linderina macrospora]
MSYTLLDLFDYHPVNGVPEAAAGLFAIMAAIQIWQTIHYSAPKWMYILVGTAIAECVGYIVRSVILYHTSLGIFIFMNLCLLLPPNALALFNYKVIGEIVRRSNVPPRRFWLKHKFIVWFFFGSDVFSFLIQATGGSMQSSESTRNAGKYIALFGLAIQLIFFGCFVAITIYVKRCASYVVSAGPKDKTDTGAKIKLMRVILATTALLYVRSIYRVAEFADGYGGKIYGAEWAFYVFDCLAMLACFVIYILWFVGHHFPSEAVGEAIAMYSA